MRSSSEDESLSSFSVFGRVETSGEVISGDVISGEVMSGEVTSGEFILSLNVLGLIGG